MFAEEGQSGDPAARNREILKIVELDNVCETDRVKYELEAWIDQFTCARPRHYRRAGQVADRKQRLNVKVVKMAMGDDHEGQSCRQVGEGEAVRRTVRPVGDERVYENSGRCPLEEDAGVVK